MLWTTTRASEVRAKLEFALQLPVEMIAAFMTATEHHGRDVAQSSTMLEGRVTKAQVALEEGLGHYTTNTDHTYGSRTLIRVRILLTCGTKVRR